MIIGADKDADLINEWIPVPNIENGSLSAVYTDEEAAVAKTPIRVCKAERT